MRFNIRGAHINLTSKTIAIDPGTGATSVPDQIKTVEILLDRASIEVFVNGGELSSTTFVLPQENGLSVKAEGGAVTVQSLTVYPLDSAWKDGIGN